MAMRPDPTFHASPKLAMEAPPEDFAYTMLLSSLVSGSEHDFLFLIDLADQLQYQPDFRRPVALATAHDDW